VFFVGNNRSRLLLCDGLERIRVCEH
jgi:hypothetical protein